MREEAIRSDIKTSSLRKEEHTKSYPDNVCKLQPKACRPVLAVGCSGRGYYNQLTSKNEPEYLILLDLRHH